jgi:hypothetical protein
VSGGPWHYGEAIRILDEIGGQTKGKPLALSDALAAAQIHATLALAAATAISHNGDMPVDDSDGWLRVATDG